MTTARGALREQMANALEACYECYPTRNPVNDLLEHVDAYEAATYEQVRLRLTSAITSYTNMADGIIEHGGEEAHPSAGVLLAAIRTMEEVRDMLDEAVGENPLQVLARLASERAEGAGGNE